MTINVTKPSVNLREKLNELETNKGLKGNEILQAETAQEVRSLIGAGRKNLIINGDMQVSQRGDFTTATSVSNATYYLDRFKTVLAAAMNITHKSNQILPNGKYVNTLLQTLTSSGYMGLQQFVEDFNVLKGQTVTLSAWVKSNIAVRLNIHEGFNQPTSSHTGGGQWERLKVTHTCPTNTNQMRVELWTGSGKVSGDYFEVAQVQLELGSVATDFEHRSYGEELALCQRYYWQGGLDGSGVSYKASNVTTARFDLGSASFGQALRTEPTLSIITAPVYQGCSHFALVTYNNGNVGFGHQVTTSGTTAYRAYGGIYSADAEL